MLNNCKTFRVKDHFSASCMKELKSITVNVDNKLRYLRDHCQIPIWICDGLRDFVSFVQFKEQEKHPWKSLAFSKAVGFSLQLYKK